MHKVTEGRGIVMKIIVVEDEIRIREGICNLVERISDNYHVVATADNGKDGYELICKHEPDIVISDILMPEMNGIEMLEKLRNEGKMPNTILISAYSEFSYAQTAIRLGVREYLTKPVTIDELTNALSNLENEQPPVGEVPEELSSLGNVMFGILNGIIDINEEMEKFLSSRYDISENTEFTVMNAYLGYYYEENVTKVRKTIEQMLSVYEGQKSTVIELPNDMSLIAIMYNVDNQENIERIMQENIRKNSVSLHRVCLGMIRSEGISSIKTSYNLINNYLHWNMMFGDDVLITFPKITKIYAEKSAYPADIENKMKAAVYAKDKVTALQEVKKFENYYFCGKLYDPREVKEAYSRFIWAARETGKDISDRDLTETVQKNLIERIDNAKSSGEMHDILDVVFSEILRADSEENAVGLTVKKTIKLIHDYYKDGITLDEIAGRLNITPEYLSAQFQKEMGLNFSSYIRNYRIGKAKHLLVGSNMKVYEVARQVGYQDSKYFSRVFRQVTGQKPDEYRKTKR